MLGESGWIALGTAWIWLALFCFGTLSASHAAGRSTWLFDKARGKARLAAIAFRLAFVLALAGPLVWLALPGLHKADPLWTEGSRLWTGLPGALIAVAGAMIAFAAQMSMGTSWRVGVAQDEIGALVTHGLYRISRNPTFLGQALLLGGLALAVPSVPTFSAVLLFFIAASVQISEEEAALRRAHGTVYEAWSRAVPRWIGRGRQLLFLLVILAAVIAVQLTKHG